MKLILKYILLIATLTIITFAIFLTLNDSNKKLEARYQQGIIDGQNQLNEMLFSNLQKDGVLRLNVQNKDGAVQQIILVPQLSQ